MLIRTLTFLMFVASFFFVCVNLGLSDEESDYFMVLTFEILLSIFYFFILNKITFDLRKNKKAIIYSIVPILIIVISFNSFYSPLRIEGGDVKNTIIYLSLIILFQILKLVFLGKKYFS